MNRVRTACCIVGMLVVCAVPVRPDDAPNLRPLVEGNTQFALALYKSLVVPGKNLVVSPYSVSTSLAMTSMGAWGKTLQEMHRALRLSMNSEAIHGSFAVLADALEQRSGAGVRLTIANGIWLNKGLEVKKQFLTSAERSYKARADQLDFSGNAESSRREINEWISKKTAGRIAGLLPPGSVSPATSLVLANALYFLGNWEYPFDPKKTHTGKFIIGKKRQVPAVMMRGKMLCRFLETPQAHIASLPYKGGALSLVVFLPSAKLGIEKFEKGLTAQMMSQWLSRLQRREMEITIPRFTIAASSRLNETLKKMGMSSAFGPAADFSGIGGKLFISDVFHSAYIEVNETGTEAAASTAVSMTKNGSRRAFRADRPFVYAIVDNATGSVLFMGRVYQPKG
ncbi:MAG TPA: serpin family protein [Spirochaetota bacterium]|nr:serpin family protein [Spirochaetota bacterium]HNT09633.1 serpin family protein [Spirochaetota bacterium]